MLQNVCVHCSGFIFAYFGGIVFVVSVLGSLALYLLYLLIFGESYLQCLDLRIFGESYL